MTSINREVCKAGWIQAKKRPKKKKKPIYEEEFWVIFCVHNDQIPLLEWYTNDQDVPFHRPLKVLDVFDCCYISPVIEDDRSFTIGFKESQRETLEFSTLSATERQEWIDMLHLKLRLINCLDSNSNLYSPLPSLTNSMTAGNVARIPSFVGTSAATPQIFQPPAAILDLTFGPPSGEQLTASPLTPNGNQDNDGVPTFDAPPPPSALDEDVGMTNVYERITEGLRLLPPEARSEVGSAESGSTTTTERGVATDDDGSTSAASQRSSSSSGQQRPISDPSSSSTVTTTVTPSTPLYSVSSKQKEKGPAPPLPPRNSPLVCSPVSPSPTGENGHQAARYDRYDVVPISPRSKGDGMYDKVFSQSPQSQLTVAVTVAGASGVVGGLDTIIPPSMASPLSPPQDTNYENISRPSDAAETYERYMTPPSVTRPVPLGEIQSQMTAASPLTTINEHSTDIHDGTPRSGRQSSLRLQSARRNAERTMSIASTISLESTTFDRCEDDVSAVFPPSVVAPTANRKLTLTERQVIQLRAEMERQGVVVKLSFADLTDNLAIVDFAGRLWIAGWTRDSHKRISGVCHIGDRISAVGEQKIHGWSVDKLISHLHKGPAGEMIALTIDRLPYAKIFAIRREFPKQYVGIALKSRKNTITDIDHGSLAHQAGLTPCGASFVKPPPALSPWVITEIDGRPLDLLAKSADSSAEKRLNPEVGLDLTVLVQPKDFIKTLKEQLKKKKDYKKYTLC